MSILARARLFFFTYVALATCVALIFPLSFRCILDAIEKMRSLGASPTGTAKTSRATLAHNCSDFPVRWWKNDSGSVLAFGCSWWWGSKRRITVAVNLAISSLTELKSNPPSSSGMETLLEIHFLKAVRSVEVPGIALVRALATWTPALLFCPLPFIPIWIMCFPTQEAGMQWRFRLTFLTRGCHWTWHWSENLLKAMALHHLL